MWECCSKEGKLSVTGNDVVAVMVAVLAVEMMEVVVSRRLARLRRNTNPFSAFTKAKLQRNIKEGEKRI